jgi:hypothetical protein
MAMTGPGSRDSFRAYALDGAVQYFHPRSGTHVRVAGRQTRHVRKAAPRVVMFGVTNDCNLACRFCSRDQRRDGRWTVASAFDVLRDLAAAGVLEVAFGGGEPFLFPGFAELVRRLHEQTPLALNVTTNGTRLDQATWAPFAGRFGQVRVSLYGDTVWRRCAALFAGSGQLWGANVLVDDAALATLPSTLADLAAAGCHDVSLLGYVGEPARLLSPRARAALADAVLASPLPCRVSVCFGSALGVPRLLAGFDNDGDCGAGSDFITVTPDQRVQSCSFQAHGFPGATAAEILAAWATRRAALAAPSPRTGCARVHADGFDPAPLPEIAVWQGFSGNNSGECVMVAKFDTVADARAYLDELLPGFQPDGEEDAGFDAVWSELFARERIAGAMTFRTPPRDLVHVGKSVLAAGYGVDDNFPELRALAWKRGARVLPGGIHVHEPTTLFGAIGARDERDRDEVVRAVEAGGMAAFVHGRAVFLPVSLAGPEGGSLAEEADALRALAGDRPVAAEIYCAEWTPADVVPALQRLGQEVSAHPRLWIRFPSVGDRSDELRRFAETLSDQRTLVGSDWLLVDPVQGRKRVAVLAYRQDAEVTALDAERVKVSGQFWRRDPPSQKGTKIPKLPMPTAEELQAALRRQGSVLADAAPEPHHRALAVEILTAEPGPTLQAMEAVADQLGLTLWSSLSDPEPMHALLRRLRADLG